MLKKAMAALAVAASITGLTAATATQALADDAGTTSLSGNGAGQQFGNSVTKGDQSPNLSLLQGTLNKPCVGLPVKVNLAEAPNAIQDISVLSPTQIQQCTENSTQAKGDEPLSHILSDIPVLSDNGNGNRNIRN